MRYNGSINGVQNNSSPTSSPGMWSINDVQENLVDANWPGDGTASFEYLLVGGGGGGGGGVTTDACGGGGGGGQVLSGTGPIDLLTYYAITVGQGGSSGNGFSSGYDGSTTSFSQSGGGGGNFSAEAIGGGAGQGVNAPSSNTPFANGGGGCNKSNTTGRAGINYTGGDGQNTNAKGGAGGGAGAGGNGSDGTAGGNGGNGGNGFLSTITGANVYYGAGGGGGSNAGSGGAGGAVGGGPGGSAPDGGTTSTEDTGERATVRSTGCGGGGAAVWGGSPSKYANGAPGENGCVILKYPNVYDISINAYGHGQGNGGPNSPVGVTVKNHPDGVHKVATFISGNQPSFYWVKSASISTREI